MKSFDLEVVKVSLLNSGKQLFFVSHNKHMK